MEGRYGRDYIWLTFTLVFHYVSKGFMSILPDLQIPKTNRAAIKPIESKSTKGSRRPNSHSCMDGANEFWQLD